MKEDFLVNLVHVLGWVIFGITLFVAIFLIFFGDFGTFTIGTIAYFVVTGVFGVLMVMYKREKKIVSKPKDNEDNQTELHQEVVKSIPASDRKVIETVYKDLGIPPDENIPPAEETVAENPKAGKSTRWFFTVFGSILVVIGLICVYFQHWYIATLIGFISLWSFFAPKFSFHVHQMKDKLPKKDQGSVITILDSE